MSEGPIRPGTNGQELAGGQIPNHSFQLGYKLAVEDLLGKKLIRFQNCQPIHIQGFCSSGKRVDPGAHKNEWCKHCVTEYKRQVGFQVQVGNPGTVQIGGQSSNAS